MNLSHKSTSFTNQTKMLHPWTEFRKICPACEGISYVLCAPNRVCDQEMFSVMKVQVEKALLQGDHRDFIVLTRRPPEELIDAVFSPIFSGPLRKDMDKDTGGCTTWKNGTNSVSLISPYVTRVRGITGTCILVDCYTFPVASPLFRDLIFPLLLIYETRISFITLADGDEEMVKKEQQETVS
jgi:hypothetical protein